MAEITPTILVSTKEEFEEKLSRVSELVERIQIDVIDGVFAENKTVDFSEISREGFEGEVDVHLMVNEPVNWIKKTVSFGADFLIGHIEKMRNQAEFVKQAKEMGLKAGLAIDLETPVEEIETFLWSNLDGVLLMAVPAGFSGQAFSKKVLKKIEKLKMIKDSLKLDFDIIVDGGVNLKNAKSCVEAGADVLAVGTAIWEAEDIKKRIGEFKSIFK